MPLTGLTRPEPQGPPPGSGAVGDRLGLDPLRSRAALGGRAALAARLGPLDAPAAGLGLRLGLAGALPAAGRTAGLAGRRLHRGLAAAARSPRAGLGTAPARRPWRPRGRPRGRGRRRGSGPLGGGAREQGLPGGGVDDAGDRKAGPALEGLHRALGDGPEDAVGARRRRPSAARRPCRPRSRSSAAGRRPGSRSAGPSRLAGGAEAASPSRRRRLGRQPRTARRGRPASRWPLRPRRPCAGRPPCGHAPQRRRWGALERLLPGLVQRQVTLRVLMRVRLLFRCAYGVS